MAWTSTQRFAVAALLLFLGLALVVAFPAVLFLYFAIVILFCLFKALQEPGG